MTREARRRDPEATVPHLPTPPWLAWTALWLLGAVVIALIVAVVWVTWSALGLWAVAVLAAGVAWLMAQVVR